MARWDPGAEERLKKAALELYRTHGYERVTVTQIAEHAGLTRRSFFRYFPDKREVLFAGSEQLAPAVSEAVLAVDADAAPLAAALEALAAIGTRLVAYADDADERRAVIDASPELQERERSKLAGVTTAVRDALRQRGADAGRADLDAQLAMVVFRGAFDRWVEGRGRQDFPECLREVTDLLRHTVAGGR
ncbi:TetR/AcrR family transcriptional regulator [Streptomyces sp. SID14478]|uniref:TetR/AcrR family transcriptional regulator n=1 Tax=Streptomyces sp. SID14478 TaxID=2706073 RepID=UPI0013DFD932|nr:TetR/AcrR family transcriptional regulator [Streptomyces sp. SID14478]NEB81319.1 TetR/AcrR family transcriptional regulator [Streptomyces sp. SID14478]